MCKVSKFLLLSICNVLFLGACQMMMKETPNDACPTGLVETINVGMGESVICCPTGTIAKEGMCVDTPQAFEAQPATDFPAPNTVVALGVEPATPQQDATQNPLVYLTALNGKGSAYCPERANSVAWNGMEFKCCGYGRHAVEVPSRSDSLCCPTGSINARWIGRAGFDFECCPADTVEVKNMGSGDKYICCKKGQEGKDGVCKNNTELAKEGKILLTAPNHKGKAYCPNTANSLAWNGSEFQCCAKGIKSTVIPSRTDSICCPTATTDARWIGKEWNDFECCPVDTVEVKNIGDGDKYICCPKGNKGLNGKCVTVQ